MGGGSQTSFGAPGSQDGGIPEPYGVDPSIAPGLPRPQGWRVALPSGLGAWDKTGPLDTDWTPVTAAALVGVTQIIAGTNVTISPVGGTGNVTVNAAGGPALGNTASDVGATSSGGAAATASRSDHVHAGVISLVTGETGVAALASNATNTAPDLLVIRHTTSGTAAASFGQTTVHELESAGGTTRRAATFATTWTTATNAAEVARHAISVMVAGTLLELMQINGANGGQVRISNANAGTANGALIVNSTGGQSLIQLAISDTVVATLRGDSVGNLNVSSIGGDIFVFTDSNIQKIRLFSGATGSISLGFSSPVANNATGGFIMIPTSTTTGAPSGVPANFDGTHTPLFYNRTDSKIWFNEANTWKFAPTTVAITPSITNNVTAGGTNDTIDNVVAASVDTTAASLVTTRNAIYQLARKLQMLTDLYD